MDALEEEGRTGSASLEQFENLMAKLAVIEK
jgi:hypothetical protein